MMPTNYLDNNDFFFAPKGWICPKCGRVYSPSTPICWYCGGEKTTTVDTGTSGTLITDNNNPASTTTTNPSNWIKYNGNSISLDTSKMTEEEKKNLETYFSEWR